MIKAEIKKEITITNKEIAQFLYEDGSTLESIQDILEDMLYNEYHMEYATRVDAVNALTPADYVEILECLANKLKNTK